MKRTAFIFIISLLPFSAQSKTVKDTLVTRQNDKIILTYDISVSDENISIRFENNPRIIPEHNMRAACKGKLELLKVVFFDRIGNFGNVKWVGISPTAFITPSGLTYIKSNDGYYIVGETTLPVSFKRNTSDKAEFSIPLYIALYEKKQTYKIIGSTSRPLKISVVKTPIATTARTVRTGTETERIAIQSSEEVESDNREVTQALASIQMVKQLLATEEELPFSQALQMEIFNLRSMKERVNDHGVIDKINEVILLYNDKERELKELQRNASLEAQAQEQALLTQQKAEEEAREKQAEEKERIQQEKQQKKTLWMIIGGIVLGILAFIGNAIFKHFRDIRNQKSIMQMQESLTRQAEHEATRRSREIMRNKAHQMANQGRSKMRQSLKQTGKTKKNTKIKSI